MAKKFILPISGKSEKLLVKIDSAHIAMFRFLLEAYENLAFFTVLERRPALLKITFAPHCRDLALKALEEMQKTIPFEIREWPHCG